MATTKATKAVKPEIITVEVTDKHIKRGTPNEGESCPIALALRGMRYQSVSVGPHELTMSRGKKRFYAVLPMLAQRFVNKFDTNIDGRKIVKPFSFKLKLAKNETYTG